MEHDIYEDKKYNREIEKKQESKSDRKIMIIMLVFLLIIFLGYTKDSFTKIVKIDDMKYKVKEKSSSVVYTGVLSYTSEIITIKGEKDVDQEAVITINANDNEKMLFSIHYSDNTDWDHSNIELYDHNGLKVFSRIYDVKPVETYYTNELNAVKKVYSNISDLSLRKGVYFRGNVFLYILVIILIGLEGLSPKLWKILHKYQVGWAVDRGVAPSYLYRQVLRAGQFILFLSILCLMYISYF